MTSSYVEKVLDQFIEQYQGKSIDVSGMYGPQSPDLIAAYMAALTGRERPYPYTYAFDLWPDVKGFMHAAGFVRVTGDYEQGDIAVYGPGLGISDFGTLAIVTGVQGKYMEGFTQTPGPAHFRPFSATSLLGAWRLTAGAECVRIYEGFAQAQGGEWVQGSGRFIQHDGIYGDCGSSAVTEYLNATAKGRHIVTTNAADPTGSHWMRDLAIERVPSVGDVAFFKSDPQNPYGHTEIITKRQARRSRRATLAARLRALFGGKA